MTRPPDNLPLLDEGLLERCTAALCDDLWRYQRTKWLLFRYRRAEKLAHDAARWTKYGRRELRLRGDHLRDHVKYRMELEYGSLWTLILFTILWELIKRYLIDIL